MRSVNVGAFVNWNMVRSTLKHSVEASFMEFWKVMERENLKKEQEGLHKMWKSMEQIGDQPPDVMIQVCMVL